ncbi:MAG: hypothetical protein LJF30_07695 [Acidobacteria bacterium]|jgi:uncharacterized protein (DUF1697 family)|nr:hypothetical protein [Acidobacteriota bacterium]
MGHVVFLRAANVGGRNVFRPAQLARDLAPLGVVNVGAAGTFVVRGKASATAIRREILAWLPFEPALVVVPAREVVALVDGAPFAGVRFSKDRRGWAAVLDRRPRHVPGLPLFDPGRGDWSVRFDRVDGRFALGLWQRRSRGFVFPSHVVEKALDGTATTRWWETIERVARLLRDAET